MEQPDERVRPDRVCRSGNSELIVECKAMNLYRASNFRAAVGDAILRFQHSDRGARPAQRRLLMAFLLQRMSSKAEDDLKDYCREYLPDLQWVIIAEDGSGVVHIGERDERISASPFRGGVNRESAASRSSLFSPNNQWLFKVLLLSGLDSRYWGGPSRRPEGISELAAVSGVPQPSVSVFIHKAEQEGFLKRGPKGFVIQHHQELLDDWGYALKNKSRRAIGLRSLYPDEPEEKFLRRVRSYCQNGKAGVGSAPVVVGGHFGCHLLGLGRSNVRQIRLYADRPVEDILSALDLVKEQSQSPQVLLIPEPGKESVFRCAVHVDGVPVCDILQCYFDVRFSYARGREQADYIYERVLQPYFERGQ
jgi:hypothetical protein